MSSPPSPRKRGPERLYFAFGSNLHLAQMAKRCPESRYIGTAKLHDYRFQSNERGFANILPSRGDHVEGLVYLLSKNDEVGLDRSEGVPRAYQKHSLFIEVSTAGVDHVGRRVSDLAPQLDYPEFKITRVEASTAPMKPDHESPHDPYEVHRKQRTGWPSISSTFQYCAGRDEEHATNDQDWVKDNNNTKNEYSTYRVPQPSSIKGQLTEALVYVSGDFTRDSDPRNEYIDRMNAGIIDARELGMSETYIGTCLRMYIPARGCKLGCCGIQRGV